MTKKSIDFIKVKSISGKIVRFFAKSFLVLFIALFIVGCVGGAIVGVKVWPTIEEYKNELFFQQINILLKLLEFVKI